MAEIVQQIASGGVGETDTLDRLLKMVAEIELLSSSSAFRFGAAGANEAIVNRRIAILHEVRLHGRQLFAEFMSRRYDSAMRTCRSAQDRLTSISARAEHAANLLRTRVDVASSEQNHEVLRKMDRRAALHLRLQKTVEGLFVVAISYYAVSLAGYLLSPIAYEYGYDKSTVLTLITPPIVGLAFAISRRIHNRLDESHSDF